jgi:hypothetical protein
VRMSLSGRSTGTAIVALRDTHPTSPQSQPGMRRSSVAGTLILSSVPSGMRSPPR